MRTFGGTDDFVKFQLDRDRVAMLAVLDYKKHEDRNNRSERVDDELPRVVETKKRALKFPPFFGQVVKVKT